MSVTFLSNPSRNSCWPASSKGEAPFGEGAKRTNIAYSFWTPRFLRALHTAQKEQCFLLLLKALSKELLLLRAPIWQKKDGRRTSSFGPEKHAWPPKQQLSGNDIAPKCPSLCHSTHALAKEKVEANQFFVTPDPQKEHRGNANCVAKMVCRIGE